MSLSRGLYHYGMLMGAKLSFDDPPERDPMVTFVVRNHGHRNFPSDLERRREDKPAFKLKIVTMDELNFYPKNLADCYIFDSDTATSPWIMNLGRYLPSRPDWTTTTEILQRTGFRAEDPHHGDSRHELKVIFNLLMGGKIVPLEPFGVTWLFMRRHYTILFCEKSRRQVGCSKETYRRILQIFQKQFEPSSYQEKAVPENCITVSDFLVNNPIRRSGIGEKYSKIITETLNLYGLKVFTE